MAVEGECHGIGDRDRLVLWHKDATRMEISVKQCRIVERFECRKQWPNNNDVLIDCPKRG